MEEFKKIKEHLRAIIDSNPNLPITAIVDSVENDECTVTLKGGLKLTNVKLKATSNESDDFFLLRPVVGSTVLMLSLSGSLENLTVVKVDKAASMSYKQGGLEVNIDSETKKVSIKNEEASLVDIMQDLVTILREFKVFTPSGPSGTALPPVVLQIEAFETKFNQLLN